MGADCTSTSQAVRPRYLVVVLSSLAVLLSAACRINVTVTGPLPVDRHGDSRATASPVDARSKTAGFLGRGDTDYFRMRMERTTDTVAVLQDRWGHPSRSELSSSRTRTRPWAAAFGSGRVRYTLPTVRLALAPSLLIQITNLTYSKYALLISDSGDRIRALLGS